MDGITDAGTLETEQPKADDSTKGQDKNREEEYKKLQGDYTRKSQKLAELQKDNTKPVETEEETTLKEWLKSNGFASVEDVEKMKDQTLNESSFKSLLGIYPDLGSHEKAIRELQQLNGGSFEEVAINYGFTTSDKLEKVRQNRGKMVGTDKSTSKGKSIGEMSLAEYVKFKKDGGFSKGSSFKKAQTF